MPLRRESSTTRIYRPGLGRPTNRSCPSCRMSPHWSTMKWRVEPPIGRPWPQTQTRIPYWALTWTRKTQNRSAVSIDRQESRQLPLTMFKTVSQFTCIRSGAYIPRGNEAAIFIIATLGGKRNFESAMGRNFYYLIHWHSFLVSLLVARFHVLKILKKLLL